MTTDCSKTMKQTTKHMDATYPDFAKMQPHNTVAMVVRRDCHVATPDSDVIKHVISRLKDGAGSFWQMDRTRRRYLIWSAIREHREHQEFCTELRL